MICCGVLVSVDCFLLHTNRKIQSLHLQNSIKNFKCSIAIAGNCYCCRFLIRLQAQRCNTAPQHQQHHAHSVCLSVSVEHVPVHSSARSYYLPALRPKVRPKFLRIGGCAGVDSHSSAALTAVIVTTVCSATRRTKVGGGC